MKRRIVALALALPMAMFGLSACTSVSLSGPGADATVDVEETAAIDVTEEPTVEETEEIEVKETKKPDTGGMEDDWDAVEDDFMNGCEGGGGSSMPGYCQCVFDELKDNYTIAEVEKMADKGAMSDEIIAIATDCLEKLQ